MQPPILRRRLRSSRTPCLPSCIHPVHRLQLQPALGQRSPNHRLQPPRVQHDDALTSTTNAAFHTVLDGKRSANGCPAAATFFTTSDYTGGWVLAPAGCPRRALTGARRGAHQRCTMLRVEKTAHRPSAPVCSPNHPPVHPPTRPPAHPPIPGLPPVDCTLTKALHDAGHEIADHTVHHYDLSGTLAALGGGAGGGGTGPCTARRGLGALGARGWAVLDCTAATPGQSSPPPSPPPRAHPGNSKAQVVDAVVGARAKLAACGIPAKSIAGFRQPYLSSNPTVRQVGSCSYCRGTRFGAAEPALGGDAPASPRGRSAKAAATGAQAAPSLLPHGRCVPPTALALHRVACAGALGKRLSVRLYDPGDPPDVAVLRPGRAGVALHHAGRRPSKLRMVGARGRGGWVGGGGGVGGWVGGGGWGGCGGGVVE